MHAHCLCVWRLGLGGGRGCMSRAPTCNLGPAILATKTPLGLLGKCRCSCGAWFTGLEYQAAWPRASGKRNVGSRSVKETPSNSGPWVRPAVEAARRNPRCCTAGARSAATGATCHLNMPNLRRTSARWGQHGFPCRSTPEPCAIGQAPNHHPNQEVSGLHICVPIQAATGDKSRCLGQHNFLDTLLATPETPNPSFVL